MRTYAEKARNSPIFIVGVARSGTTLLAAMLGAHSRISCGPETQFFHFLAQANIDRLTQRGTWPNEAVKFLFSMIQTKKPVPLNYGSTQDEIRSYLSKRRISVQTMLNAITEPYMNVNGKVRWLEKTPRHILHLDAIRLHFPDSPIIRIVRDPRDVASSILRTGWNWSPKTFVNALMMWKYCDDRSKDFFSKAGRRCTVRFEDMVRSPETELRKICSFIGEDYECNMLQTWRSYTQVNKLHEPWKKKVREPLDISRVAAWKKELNSEQQRQAECLVGDRLVAYGYPTTSSDQHFVQLYPADSVSKYPKVCSWLAQKKNTRLWPIVKNESPSITLLVGDPEKDMWLGQIRIQRIKRLVSILLKVSKVRLLGKEVYWMSDKSYRNGTGYLTNVLCFVLNRIVHTLDAGPVDRAAMQWLINLNTHPQISTNNPGKTI